MEQKRIHGNTGFELLNPNQRKRFFETLATESGVMSEEYTKRVYYGLVRMIGKKLTKNAKIVCPDLGVFKIIHHAERRKNNVNTMQMYTVPAQRVIKFSADYKMKKHFNPDVY